MIGYLDLPSGLSGDMFLGCLVDAGWPISELERVISQMNLPASSVLVRSETAMRGPIRGTLVSVETAETHHARHLADVRTLIEASSLPQVVKGRAIAVFTRLAHAEAGVHGTTVEQIHFHEVGALDAIADIVGVCAGLHALGIGRLYASSVPVGPGWINSAHGMLPLPAPATLQLLAAAGAPVRPAPFASAPAVAVSGEFEVKHEGKKGKHGHAHGAAAGTDPAPRELVTPTAAALLSELATFQQPAMRLVRVGVGAGQRQFSWPNVARLWLGEDEAAGPIVQVDTNIDDMNPQFFASVSERLFAAGALDVWLTPIQMKKGRPGVLLSVICPGACEQAIADVLLRETTTLGMRVHTVHRHEAARDFREVQTQYGVVRVKVKLHGDQIVGAMPEYEDCKRLADEAKVPIRVVYAMAQTAAQGLAGGR